MSSSPPPALFRQERGHCAPGAGPSPAARDRPRTAAGLSPGLSGLRGRCASRGARRPPRGAPAPRRAGGSAAPPPLPVRSRGAARAAGLSFPRRREKAQKWAFTPLSPPPPADEAADKTRGGRAAQGGPRKLRGVGLGEGCFSGGCAAARAPGELRCQVRPRRGRQYQGPNG